MILPIGHERTTVLRVPWITLALIAACLIVFLGSRSTILALGQREQVVLRQVEAVVRDTPSVVVPPDLAQAIGWDREGMESLSEALEGLAAGSSALGLPSPSPPANALEIAAAQRTLDELVLTWRNLGAKHPFRRWGLIPTGYQFTDLITYAFLHGGWMHLLGNLFLLYLAAPPLEDVWGRPLLAGFYLLAAMFSGFAWATVDGGSVPCVGASGAIAAVMGAFLVRFWHVRIRFWYFFLIIFRPITGTFEAPAWMMLPLWFFGQLLSAWSDSGGSAGVAWWAHIWGFGFGAFGAMVVHFFGVERHIAPKIAASVGLVENPVLGVADAALRRGDTLAAKAALEAELAGRPNNRDAALVLWDVALKLGEAPSAAPHLVRVLAEELREGDTELALGHLAEVRHFCPTARLPPATAVRALEALLDRGDLESARIEVELLAAGPLAGPLAARTARALAQAGEPAVAFVQLALADPNLDPGTRGEIERLRS